jgi:hypothetical protein
VADLWRNLGVIAAYLFFGMCGVLVFVAPSVSLAAQGGRVFIYIWGGCCFAGSVLGLIGIIWRLVFTELWGVSFAAAASLTWATALVLQAVKTDSAVALTAAGLASALTVLLLQRWLDANRPPRR